MSASETASPPRAKPPASYRRDIDGLRALAVLPVVAFHAAPKLVTGGFVGVDIFFVISGYLISGILLDELATSNTVSFANFYRRRIQRIFPALLLVFTAGLALGWITLFADELEQLGKHIAGGVGFATNFVLWREAGYFNTASEAKPFLHLWSLAIEEQFYLVFPWLMLLLRGEKRRRFAVLAGLFMLSLAASLVVSPRDPTKAFFLPHTRVWELLIGALAATASSTHHVGGFFPARWFTPAADASRSSLGRFVPFGLSALGLAAVCVSIVAFHAATPWPSGWALAPTLGALALLIAGERSAVNRVVLGNRVMVAIGLISYPLYLWHWLLLSFVHVLGAGDPRPEFVVGAVALSFLLSALTYRFVEKPIRSGPPLKAKPFVLGGLMALMGLAGLVVYARSGFPERSLNARNRGAIEYRKVENELKSNCASVLGGDLPVGICYANDPHPEFAIFGDSHALAAYQPLFLGKVPTRSVLIAQPACVPFSDYVLESMAGEDLQCDGFADAGLDILRKTPSIKTVVVFKRPTLWMNAAMDNGVVTYSDGVQMRPKFPRSQVTRLAAAGEGADRRELTAVDYYFDGFDRLMTRLDAMPVTAVLVIDNPDLEVMPQECAQRPYSLQRGLRRPRCERTRAGLDRGQAVYLSIVDRLQQRHPKMVLFDARPPFCDETYCYGRDGADVLYRDNNHLNSVGAEKLVRPLLDFIKALPPVGQPPSSAVAPSHE